MIDVLSQATHNFVQHQLRLTSTEITPANSGEFFHANITLTRDGENKPADFYYTNDFIQLVSEALLGEPSEDSEAIEDLIGETTNLIAGSAKTIAENSFDIGLPTYIGKVSQIPGNGTYRAFSIDNKMMLGIALH
jgi:hypothetical protein